MAKYAPLASYLRRQKRSEVTLSFRDIERIVSGILPKAATAEGWWRPESGATVMPQHLALAEAGFVAEPQLRTETVRFVRADAVRSDGQDVLTEGRSAF